MARATAIQLCCVDCFENVRQASNPLNVEETYFRKELSQITANPWFLGNQIQSRLQIFCLHRRNISHRMGRDTVFAIVLHVYRLPDYR